MPEHKKTLLLGPFFFAVSFILAHFLNNIGELSLDVLPIPIISSVIFSLIVLITSFLLIKKGQNAISFSCIFLIMFFFYGQIFGSNVLFFTIWLLIVLIAFLKIRNSQNLTRLNQFFLVTSIIILIIPAIQIVIFQLNRVKSSVKVPSLAVKKNTSRIPKSSYPDIYYIIPDSYSASKSLQKYYGFDNTQFINFLSKQDFFIASNSASNYPKTFLSLGSSLNMQYLDFLKSNNDSSDLALVDPMIKENLVVNYLKSLGYRYYHLGSWWGATQTSVEADKNFLLEDEKLAGIGTFNYVILQSTALNPLIKYGLGSFALGNSEDDQRNRVIYQFNTLSKISTLPGPKFVFAHIISPHEPYVFDPNCQPIVLEQTKTFKEEQNYIRQVECINKKFESTINSIISQSKRPVVIIIQSDEGAPFLAERMNPPDSWGDQASDDLLHEKFPVFTAIRMPEIGNQNNRLYLEISPVNIFRTVFNYYFQVGLPILPDKHYIFSNLKDLYNFKEISAQIGDTESKK